MSAQIWGSLLDLAEAGDLVRIPSRSRHHEIRPLFCATAVWRQLASLPARSGESHVLDLLSAYVAGGYLRVRAAPSKARYARLAWLDPPSDQVWALRFWNVDPQIRIFGRFADHNVFVALLVREKPECHTAAHYRSAMSECARLWRVLLPGWRPYAADRPHDYVPLATVVGL